MVREPHEESLEQYCHRAIAEYMVRVDCGEQIDREEFIRQHPQIAEQLRGYFAATDAVSAFMRLEETHADVPLPHDANREFSPAEDRFGVVIPSGELIGRYRVVREIGAGGFGRVYLCRDDMIERDVAVKVPHQHLLTRPEDVAFFITEAQVVASLDHSSIVPVYDAGKADNGSCYVVSKYIQGTSLAERIKAGATPHCEAAKLVATVAEALHHAHLKGLVHRDIKPGNILLDLADKPYVADFGLALREEEDAKGPSFVGTPAYMSPEQAQGEGHRVDGRSDVFSLGIVLYELLTGWRPFSAESRDEVLAQIVTRDPRPPRQRDDAIPKELERVCLKALSKRASERYTTARDMADDLYTFLAEQEVGSGPAAPLSTTISICSDAPPEQTSPPTSWTESHTARIIPKGLRSFDAHDADFFLELLPGPRDRMGLPDSIRFWKNRVEEVDPDTAFCVGLIYGPSGCGKSSFIRAGFVPHLAEHVIPVYVEASGRETEARLLAALQKHCDHLGSRQGVRETIATLRRGRGLPSGKKILIILDQFEQWLHANKGGTDRELVSALRQCDGARIQCIVAVRDDFWMAVTRFMQQLEIRLVEGQNSASVDLFSLRHSKKVLVAFGRAFGVLPESAAELQKAHELFLEQAALGLAEDGKVISVRLALFAEMVKDRPWTPATLEAVGGTKGVGVTFLEQAFCSKTANPKCRLHQRAARDVLRALLPECGTNIKGSMRSSTELLEASGYHNRPGDFDDLLALLDGNLRLITPTDSEGAEADSRQEAGSKCYQLTHDYLIPSLREWLTQKQKETRRGRAELRLAERASLWNARRENRNLPSWLEWVSIRLLTERKKWSEVERRMMRRVGWYRAVQATVLLATLAAAVLISLSIRIRVIESIDRQRSEGLVNALLTAEIEQVPQIVDRISQYRKWADPALLDVCRVEKGASAGHLRASLALLPVDPTQVGYLKNRLLSAASDEVPILRDALLDHKERLVDEFWRILQNPRSWEQAQVLQTASALAVYDPDSEWWDGVSGTVTDALVSAPPVHLSQWIQALSPVRVGLLPHLVAVYRNLDGKYNETQQALASSILDVYAADQPEILADLIMDARPEQFALLYPALAQHKRKAVRLLKAELDRQLKPSWEDARLDPAWTTPDLSVVQQIESADGLVAERYALCQTMALNDFSQIADKLRASGYRPIRFRPYAASLSPHVAAVWARDGRHWEMVHGLSVEDIRNRDDELRGDGFMPVDVAGYVASEDGTSVERYAAVWVRRTDCEEDTRMYVAASDAENDALCEAIEKEGFILQNTMQAFRDLAGQQKYCGVKSRSDESSSLTWNCLPSTYEDWKDVACAQEDVDVSNASNTQAIKERCAETLAEAEEDLKSQPDDSSARLTRALANYHLGNNERALDDFQVLIEKNPTVSAFYGYRAVLHARMGKEVEAKTDLAKSEELGEQGADKAYLDAVVATYLNKDDEAMPRLEAAIEDHPGDTDFLFQAACVYSIASEVLAQGEPTKSKLFADRAVALLDRALANADEGGWNMETDPDLGPIHDHPGYQALLAKGHFDRRYAGVASVSAQYESTELHEVSPQDHLVQCQQLAARDFRPAAISATAIGDTHTVVTASVWHRPLISEEAKERLAERQANAAIALLRMKEEQRVWPLLKHSVDPRVRSWMIHRLCPMGVDFQAIAKKLDQEPEVSVHQALILSLGQYANLPSIERAAMVNKLVGMYRDDPDPGIHGAVEWLLRKWNEAERLDQIDEQLATGSAEGRRQWYINGQGQTMVVISGPVEFAMGSPGTEPDRESTEQLHRRRIGRSFAIATKEVTVEQFQEFRRENSSIHHEYVRKHSPEQKCPQTAVTWYEAAAYCRWLSEKEGIPEEQMCYPPIPEIKEGMVPLNDYLQRTGYRLPTEAEWEYSCRSAASTSRYYGQSDQLLGEYAWYMHTAHDRSWPVGLLKPNALGLFDMHGNVLEWCQERYLSYGPTHGSRPADDREDAQPVQEMNHRVIRGGAFSSLPRYTRCAVRYTNQPTNRDYFVGFRTARTCP